MGVHELFSNLISPSNIDLTDTVRPYFLRSVSLINACRLVQLHYKNSGKELKDEQDLRRVFDLVEKALKMATNTEWRNDLNTYVNFSFEEANKAVDRYLHGNEIQRALPYLDFESAAQNDIEAQRHLKDIMPYTKKKVAFIKSLTRITFPVSILPEVVRSQGRWTENRVFFIIEKKATLDVVLFRVITILDGLHKSKNVPLFSLTQNPQFFQIFPSTEALYLAYRKALPADDDVSETQHSIQPLRVWDRVGETTQDGNVPLYLIVDRRKGIADSEVAVFGASAGRIVKDYRNIWQLDGSFRFVGREIPGALILLQPPPLSPAPSSPTLSPSPVSSTSTLLSPNPSTLPRDLKHDGQKSHENARGPGGNPLDKGASKSSPSSTTSRAPKSSRTDQRLTSHALPMTQSDTSSPSHTTANPSALPQSASTSVSSNSTSKATPLSASGSKPQDRIESAPSSSSNSRPPLTRHVSQQKEPLHAGPKITGATSPSQPKPSKHLKVPSRPETAHKSVSPSYSPSESRTSTPSTSTAAINSTSTLVTTPDSDSSVAPRPSTPSSKAKRRDKSKPFDPTGSIAVGGLDMQTVADETENISGIRGWLRKRFF